MGLLDGLKTVVSSVKKTTSAIGSAISNEVKKLEIKAINTFAPGPVVTAQRRKETFGTENKAIAGTLIVGAAATAVVAGPAIVASARAGTLIPAVVKAFTGATPLGTVGRVLTGVAVTSAVVTQPKIVTQVLGRTAQTASTTSNIVFGDKTVKEKVQEVGQLVKDNGKEILIGTALIGGAAGAAKVINDIFTDDGTSKPKEEKPLNTKITNDLVPMPQDNQIKTSVVPLTPEVIPMGQAVSSGTTRRISRKRRTQKRTLTPSIRVNVVNNSRLQTARYLNYA